MPNPNRTISRLAESAVADALKTSSVVCLLGPARCGKTTMLKKFASRANCEYLPISSEKMNWRDGLVLSARTRRIVTGNRAKRLCIDDVQFLLKFSGILNSETEKSGRPGRFLIAAQTSSRFLKEFGKLEKGTVKAVDLGPLLLHEVEGRASMETLWLRGGFPESLFAESDSASMEWRRGYAEAFANRNFHYPGKAFLPQGVRALFEAFLPNHDSGPRYKRMSDSAGLSIKSVISFMELMESTGMIRRLPSNHLGCNDEIFKKPKYYLRDTGLYHELLGIASFPQLREHEVFQRSWKTFAIENIISCMPDWSPSYFMTINGTGIELILERGGRRKLFSFRTDEGPQATPSFKKFSRELTTEPATMITPPNDTYPESYPICRTMRVMTLPAFCKAALEGREE